MKLYVNHVFCLSVVGLLCSGCVSDGTFFGQSKQQQQQKQLEQRKQQMAVINRDNRITELENSLVLLRSDFESLSNAIAVQNQRVAELEARIASESNGRNADITAINRELEMLASSQKQLTASVDAIPKNITKLLSEQEKQIMSQVDSKVAAVKSSIGSRSSSSSRSRVNYNGPCYEHVIESGETISEIAQAYGVTTKEIMEVNNIQNAARIQIGQKLYIPKH